MEQKIIRIELKNGKDQLGEEVKVIEERLAAWETQQEKMRQAKERERQAEEAELRALEEEWEEKWAKTDPNASLFERLFQAIGPDPDWVE